VIEPTDAYSAARFCTEALDAVAAIRARGRVPLLVGGTMLYFKALLEGLSALPQADAGVRAALDARAAAAGWPALHAELARVDPVTAARLAPNDAQRIQRALEVHALTGSPLSVLQGAREARGTLGGHLALALLPEDRARLHAAIAARFDAMLAAGLVDELRAHGRRTGSIRVAGDALRRLPAGVAVSRWGDRPCGVARHRHRRHAPARQAAVHLAARCPRRFDRGAGPGG
jgi:tRNA dimethylallyltransferase